MKHNIILNVDSYKASHFLQYPPGTEIVHSYVESRGGEYSNTIFFGLQAFLKEYLIRPITKDDVTDAKHFCKKHGVPFNEEGWLYIVKEHKGKLPLKIDAVLEGTIVPTHNVLVTVENTDPKCYWLTSYVETAILRAIWYPTTVATISKAIKEVIQNYLERTADSLAGLPFKLNDFGARGVSSLESSELGGMGHLLNFQGTDNIPACLAVAEYYRSAEMPGFSIPAAEHSTITSWGRDAEAQAYANMLEKYAKPGALIAVVSDSYDIYNAVEFIWGEQLKQQVIDSGAMVVVRPDSGDPKTVVGKVASLLDKKFGSTINSKGYKVLNNVRIIQGDGINIDSIRDILGTLAAMDFSAENVAFGMGGALLQHMNRDTQKFAMKCSAIRVNGEWRDVFKDPVTDHVKASKKGRQMLYRAAFSGKLFTGLLDDSLTVTATPELKTVFLNGDLMINQTFEEIKERASARMEI